jgi:hypothetical protein
MELHMLGDLLSRTKNIELVCGGEFATAQKIRQAYQSNRLLFNPRYLPIKAFFTQKSQMQTWNEPVDNEYYTNLGYSKDILVWTEKDEFGRGLDMLDYSDLIVAHTGGKGTLFEIINGILLQKPVLYLPTDSFSNFITPDQHRLFESYSRQSLKNISCFGLRRRLLQIREEISTIA